jgi:dihydrofolate reductase
MPARNDLILLASADAAGGIGKNNGLLVRIPEDMRHFREHTVGQTIIVGRKTLETFKNGRPLPDRLNIVLSATIGYRIEGAAVVRNLQELFQCLDGIGGRIYVCGGESVYRELEGFCSRAIITRFDATCGADAFLPDISRESGWLCVCEGEWETSEKGIRYRIQEYERSGG